MAEELIKAEEAEIQQKVIWDTMLNELSTYFRVSEDQALEKINYAMSRRNTEWQTYGLDNPLDFYFNSEYLVYSLAKWNAEAKHQKRYEFIKNICLTNDHYCLDFGGGIGELIIKLHNSGIDADYLEVPGKVLNFARWRFKKKLIHNEIFTNLNQINKKYTLITCIDVFGNLIDPERYLEKLSQLIVKNGILIFTLQDINPQYHPMVLEENRDFLKNIETYLTKYGFKASKFDKSLEGLRIWTKES